MPIIQQLQVLAKLFIPIVSQGYTRPREYIVTEWPLPHTLGDLWSLVYDYDCSAVVVLTNPAPSSVSPLVLSFTPRPSFTMGFFQLLNLELPSVLARRTPLRQVWPCIYCRSRLSQSLSQYQELDLPHQQEGTYVMG